MDYSKLCTMTGSKFNKINNSSGLQQAVMPCGFFWRHLAKNNQQGVLCWMPDTLILNDGDVPVCWMYSNSKGYVEKNTNASLKEFINKLSLFSSPDELVAVFKKPQYRPEGNSTNDTKLLNTKALNLQFSTNCHDFYVLQRFIKSNGDRAFICRTTFRQRGKPQSTIITNNQGFYSGAAESRKYMIRSNSNTDNVKVKTSQGKYLAQTLAYNTNIVRYFAWMYGIQIGELIADYIKDEMGTWWLINVKQVTIVKETMKIPKKVDKALKEENEQQTSAQNQMEKYQKTKTCKYCQKAYLQSQLNYKMTVKMIICTDRYLLHRGKTYKWLQRSDLANIDTHSLYEQHRVCQRCYKLYMFTEQLMELEYRFAEKIGIPVSEDSKYNLVMSAGSNYLEKESKNREVDKLEHSLPQELELGPNTKLIIQSNCPLKNDAIINKMVRYRFIIYLVSIDEMTPVELDKNYYIQYCILNVKVRYRLDIDSEDTKSVHLNKLRVVYAFSHDRKSLNQHINSMDSLTIQIVSETNDKKERAVIGSLNLELKSFMSQNIVKREYYKMFNMKGICWGWGLEANIGLDCSGLVDTSRLIFKNINEQVFYPENPDYYSCQPLPSEWMTLIKERRFDQSFLLTKKARTTMKSQMSPQTLRNEKENTNYDALQLDRQIEAYMKPVRRKDKNVKVIQL